MKKTGIIIWWMQLLSLCSWSQQREIPANPLYEQRLEAETARNETVPEDDSYQQRLELLRRRPLHLNKASAGDLEETGLLSDLQISRFLQYRQLLGRLISVYELQAIPGWDTETIRQLMPFVTVKDERTLTESLLTRMRGGEHTVLIRISPLTKLFKAYKIRDSSASGYAGSPLKILARYKYNYKNLLQFGWLGDKDAGEQFFRGSQSAGFDFNSFHFFARKIGMIQSLAIGDFTVNLGQGLIQWQSQAFKKGGEVLSVKRQGGVLRPYNSAGEFNFYRGLGVSLRHKNWELTLFGSYRKLSAHIVTDTLHHADYISSLLPSGYHRTQQEREEKNNVKQFTAGGNFQYTTSRGHTGINIVHHGFDIPFQPLGDLYDIFSMSGKAITNYSIDYSYTFQNMHFFGEAAADAHKHKAFLNGLLLSAGAATDISIVYRSIDRAYQPLYANAFTERTVPANERGWYAGISVRPAPAWQVDGYADFFQFPWLQYRADKPVTGYDYMAAITYRPDRQLQLYTRYKTETKQENATSSSPGMHAIVNTERSSWRVQMSWQVSRRVILRSRVELSWYNKISLPRMQKGFLYYTDVVCKSLLPSLSGNLRWQYVEADGYNARLYAYENDVLYSSGVPSFSGKSWRIYGNLHYSLKKIFNYPSSKKAVSVWVRMAYTKYDNSFLPASQDKVKGDHQLDFKGQILLEL